MLTIAVLSPGPGCGKTTVLVNLGIGFQRKGYRVLLAASSDNYLLREWLAPSGSDETEKIPISNGLLDCVCLDHQNPVTDLDRNSWEKLYDYIIIDAGDSLEGICPEISGVDLVLACFRAEVMDDEIYELEKTLVDIKGTAAGIDLLIPSKAIPGEWENTSHHLAVLSDHFSEERIADLIPFCEAIHDLPHERKSVWDLPPQYNNRKQTFDVLVERIMHIAADNPENS